MYLSSTGADPGFQHREAWIDDRRATLRGWGSRPKRSRAGLGSCEAQMVLTYFKHSMAVLLLNTESHRHAVDCCQNCLPYASPIVSFSSA